MDVDLFGACYIKAIKEFDFDNAEHLERYRRSSILVDHYFGQSGEVSLLTENPLLRAIQTTKRKNDGDASCGDNEDGREGYGDEDESQLTDSQNTLHQILKKRSVGKSSYGQSDKRHRSGHSGFNEVTETQYYNPRDMPCRASMELTTPTRKAVSLGLGLDKCCRQQVLPLTAQESINRKYHIANTRKVNSAQDNQTAKGEAHISNMGDSANSLTPSTAVESEPDLDDGCSDSTDAAALISLITAPLQESVQTYFETRGRDNPRIPYPTTCLPPEVLNINPEDYTDLINSDISSILSDTGMTFSHTKDTSTEVGVGYEGNTAMLLNNGVAFNFESDSNLDEPQSLFPTFPRQVSRCFQELWTPQDVLNTSGISGDDNFASGG
ncbi:hypothetical protein BGZ80_005106 [Entomortierella chlamydospora]|uniref:Uncharacterized protein n=1 Tax=Entomortierella chlamydospora TaxID=101097 RepID=A0A9P6SVS2_9FUNG|nr:hypothetical protein BGZ80_005106 [Entomortierella chlamydospora]